MRIRDWSSDVCSSDLTFVRNIVSTLPANRTPDIALADPRPPRHPTEDLYGIIPEDVRAPYDVHEVIARLVDGSEFNEFKALYGNSLVCVFAHIWAMQVAIHDKHAVSFCESAVTGAQDRTTAE